ncbi:MAG: aspartate kinase [bacterium]
MLIVQKYGGTSLETPELLGRAAARIIKARRAGNQVVVVVSAMGHETDRLVKLAKGVCSQPSEREYDMLLSTGEQVSIALLAMALHDRGQPATSFTGHQVRITTDSSHTKARIKEIDVERIYDRLTEGEVVIVAGFQGINLQGDITTLGRGGSDTTAVALAASLKAGLCEIYTDVDGVYTANPAIVKDARKIERISYDEMLELANLGASVLQPRAVEFACKYQVPLHVRCSFNENEGTMVVEENNNLEQVLVRGTSLKEDEAKITLDRVPDQPGSAGVIFSAVAEAGIEVDMIIQNIGADGFAKLSFTVPENEADKTLEIISELDSRHGISRAKIDKDIVKLSVVGVGMRSHCGVAAKMFRALAHEGINLLMISTSEIAISCVVEARYAEPGLRCLHQAFNLHNP